ncbi:alpha/beta fold hydrolase [Rhodococcus sp. NBC_00294]|uniref:alpha/beta fold hydrolase n=1 Tax=Rhodococcus sp. NBC_00294 TaxID=2976004 RepID=UPI002E29EFC3|nr:alpha/beta hydrolase [Rhodococcus sp. NBC_00294]
MLDANHGTSTLSIAGTSNHVLQAAVGDAPGSGRLRYLHGGSGSPVLLLHTVRTQAEHFHRLLPHLLPGHTVYALDLPGMGWSDIVPGASYEEPAMRAGVLRLLDGLDLRDVTVVGESMGAVLALTAAAERPDRVRRVVAINPYDYAGGILRSGLLARVIIGGVTAPIVGPLLAGVEPRPVVRQILRGGLGDRSALTEDYLTELLRVGRRPGYPGVARAVYRALPSLIAARSTYERVDVPVTLVHGDRDWSRESDRRAHVRALPHADVHRIEGAGHFLSLEKPDAVAAMID